jgi:hypothetical protein
MSFSSKTWGCLCAVGELVLIVAWVWAVIELTWWIQRWWLK